MWLLTLNNNNDYTKNIRDYYKKNIYKMGYHHLNIFSQVKYIKLMFLI